MTKPVTRKMAVDCLLHRFSLEARVFGEDAIHCNEVAWLACAICKTEIKAGEDIEFDHIHADIFDGPHEYQNLRPLHAECHKAKTKSDIQANAKIKRILADKPSKRPMQSSGRKIPSRPFQSAKEFRRARST